MSREAALDFRQGVSPGGWVQWEKQALKRRQIFCRPFRA